MAVLVKHKRYKVTGYGYVRIYGSTEERQINGSVYAASKTEAKRIALGLELLKVTAQYGRMAWYQVGELKCEEV